MEVFFALFEHSLGSEEAPIGDPKALDYPLLPDAASI